MKKAERARLCNGLASGLLAAWAGLDERARNIVVAHVMVIGGHDGMSSARSEVGRALGERRMVLKAD